MSIRNRMALWVIVVITFFLVICNSVIFSFFKWTLEEKIVSTQQSIIYSNQNTLDYFFESINQAYLQLTGDRVFGQTLSKEYEPFTLEEYEARQRLTEQFSQIISSLISADEYVYTNALFLNDSMNMTEGFRPMELDDRSPKNVSGVYKNTMVKNSDWYKNAMNNPERFYVFLNNNEFSMAHKVNNVFYTGDSLGDGLGALLITLDYQKLEKIFKLSGNSENSSFLLLSPDNVVLYKDKTGPVPISKESIDELVMRDALSNDFSNNKSQVVTMDGQKYIVNLSYTKWDLCLLFLTPFSDITNQLWPMVYFTVFVSVAILISCVATLLAVTRALTRPIVQLSERMSSINDSRAVDFDALKNVSNDEVGILYRSFSELLSRINRLILDVREQTTQKKEAELKALQAQINPHFVFNAMDVVNWIALSRGQDDIADIVNTIAAIMRYSIKEPDAMVMLSNELQNVQDYLSIQFLRYPSRIKYETDIPEGLENMPIPKFVLQPLVENSIQHGIKDSQSDISIIIKIRAEGTHLLINVMDNGCGCDVNMLNDFLANKPSNLKVSNGFGLRNVNERLQLRFPQSSGLVYTFNEDGYFTAIIRLMYDLQNLPQQLQSDENSNPTLEADQKSSSSMEIEPT